MQAGKGFRQELAIACQPAKAVAQAKERWTTQRHVSRINPILASGNFTMRQRLPAIENMLADNREQQGRLSNLYLDGSLFPKEALVERKVRLEATL